MANRSANGISNSLCIEVMMRSSVYLKRRELPVVHQAFAEKGKALWSDTQAGRATVMSPSWIFCAKYISVTVERRKVRLSVTVLILMIQASAMRSDLQKSAAKNSRLRRCLCFQEYLIVLEIEKLIHIYGGYCIFSEVCWMFWLLTCGKKTPGRLSMCFRVFRGNRYHIFTNFFSWLNVGGQRIQVVYYLCIFWTIWSGESLYAEVFRYAVGLLPNCFLKALEK
jgi:hypothetical protein